MPTSERPSYPATPPAARLPRQDGQWRWRASVQVSRADKAACDYLLVPFDAPQGVERLTVQYCVSGAVTADITDGSGNVIDIGIWDPRGAGFQEAGFRGWSGSARRAFTLGPTAETTPGYVPGPIQPGRWHVVLGLYQVRIAGCDVALAIEGRPEDAAGPPRSSPFLPGDFQGALRTQPGWYRGDLQSHTHHSDAPGSLQELANAGRLRGMDFLAVTDHNTITSWPLLAGAGGDGLLLLPAEEITTYYGHANVWGSSRWHDFRLSTPAALAQIAAEVRACGGLLSINHPRPQGPPWELGTAFDFDCLEVWNGWWQWGNHEALALWQSLLQAGRRVIAVGGSDKHQGSQNAVQSVLFVGQPTTWVYARQLSIDGILAGLRAGQVCVSAEPDGPQVRVEVVTTGGRRAVMGEELVLASQARAEVRVQVLGGAGTWLRLLRDGLTWHWLAVEDDFVDRAWLLEGAARYVRAQVEEGRPDSAEAEPGSRRLLAVSNPVWLAFDHTG